MRHHRTLKLLLKVLSIIELKCNAWTIDIYQQSPLFISGPLRGKPSVASFRQLYPMLTTLTTTELRMENVNRFNQSMEDEGSESSEPQLAESDVSSLDDESQSSLDDSLSSVQKVLPTVLSSDQERQLNWRFAGLTLWLEVEEFDQDIGNAIQYSAKIHGLQPIPRTHTTAIYGMDHLSVKEAISKLHEFIKQCPMWPMFDEPVGVIQDICFDGVNGEVMSMAWAELTLATNPAHEDALDTLYNLFYPEESSRPNRGPWKPHTSIVYDNPENTTMSLLSVMECIMKYPTILSKKRRVEAISLWDTNGTMQEWKCLERVNFNAQAQT